jgi:beta-glucanase (GH16 family)
MKGVSLLLCLFALVVMVSCGVNTMDTAQGSDQKVSTTAYTVLKWSDEFNGTAVDTAKWVFDTGNGTQGWGNWELEYYQAANATVSGGYLNITAKKQSVSGFAYTSARMKTLGKYSFKFGRINASIKLPVGQGYFPAFWMLGTAAQTWPKNGEIDIMETIGANTVYSTCHWWDDTAAVHASYGLSKAVTVTGFHTYEVEWSASMIYSRVDGVQYFAIDITPANLSELRNGNFYILLNFAIGGNWPGAPNASTVFPAAMQVVYVRVYQ